MRAGRTIPGAAEMNVNSTGVDRPGPASACRRAGPSRSAVAVAAVASPATHATSLDEIHTDDAHAIPASDTGATTSAAPRPRNAPCRVTVAPPAAAAKLGLTAVILGAG